MHTRFRRPTAAALVAAALTTAALLLVPAAPAAAHNTLRAASPADGERLTTPPTRVTLEFAQRLDPAFTTIALTDADRRKVPTGAPTVDGTKGTVTVDETLGEGTYTVAYRIVSADGHPVQGSYRFTVVGVAAAGVSGPGCCRSVGLATPTQQQRGPAEDGHQDPGGHQRGGTRPEAAGAGPGSGGGAGRPGGGGGGVGRSG
ncbi:copper resistance CopC family protein, partial [Micromonospora sp. URMC 107]|uniref:copper resistance CopC family protein n=1 Tax=Micromonospora sp. URMC 107 TaxID=3423418 RepID=UPI003F19FFF3